MIDYQVKFGRGDMESGELQDIVAESASFWRRWFVWRHFPRLVLEIEALRTQRDFAAALLHEYGRAARERAASQ